MLIGFDSKKELAGAKAQAHIAAFAARVNSCPDTNQGASGVFRGSDTNRVANGVFSQPYAKRMKDALKQEMPRDGGIFCSGWEGCLDAYAELACLGFAGVGVE